MRFLTGPTFRFHLRCAMYIALGAALATMTGVALVVVERGREMEEWRRGSDAEASRLRHELDRRFTDAEDQRVTDTADFERRLRLIAESKDASGAVVVPARAESPFSADTALATVVELICIDNADRETYYTGSGTLIDPNGLVITNRHLLVSGDDSIIRHCGIGFTRDLHLPPKIEYIATSVAASADSDLALLRVTEHLDGRPLPAQFPFVSLKGASAASSALRLGDPIYIGGYPGIGADTFTFTQGVVSGRVGADLIKTSALIDSGTSGGAAFDSAGRYVGLPTAAIKGDIGGSLGYLVGANAVEDFLEGFREGRFALPRLAQ